jgi:transcriptional regulator GlxA family with amidase domain
MSGPSVAILPLPNFTLNAFASFIDVLRLAADEGDRSRPVRLSWNVIAPTKDPVKSSCGVEICPWERLGDPARFDYIVVCGGLLRRRHNEDALIEDFLRRAASTDALIIGLCTGSFTLAQAGLLRGHRACVGWNHIAEFQEEFPDVDVTATELFLVDGKRATCAGGAGSADFAAWIVERHAGEALARKALDIMQIEAPRPGHAPQTRPPFAEKIRDDRLRKVVLLLEERCDRTISVGKLAEAAGMSRRQLERLFQRETGHSPATFAALMRLHHADWLLRTTDRPLTQIALTCGFADGAHFSRQYKMNFGRPPSLAREDRGSFASNERRPYSSSEIALPNP